METEVITIPEECPRFKICSANLCPYDPALKDRIWFPKERVCVKEKITEEFPWILSQRKIARKCEEKDKYFTVGMLMNLSQVRKATTGLSPDVSHQIQLNSWLRYHHISEKKEYTEEERQENREKMSKLRKLKKTAVASL